MTLRVLRASNGSELATASTRVKTEEELQDWLDAQAGPIADGVRAALRTDAAQSEPDGEQTLQRARMIPSRSASVMLVTVAPLLANGSCVPERR